MHESLTVPEPDHPGYRAWIAEMSPERVVAERKLRITQSLSSIHVARAKVGFTKYVEYQGDAIAELHFEGATTNRRIAGWTLAFAFPNGSVKLIDMPWTPKSDPLLGILVATFAQLFHTVGPDGAREGTRCLRNETRRMSEARAEEWARNVTAETVVEHQLWGHPMPSVVR